MNAATGYTLRLNVHIKPKKGEKIRKFQADWIGTFQSFPDRQTTIRALGREMVSYRNEKNDAKANELAGCAQVLQQMPDWPTHCGDYGNDFIRVRVRDFPLYGFPAQPVVPTAVQQVATQMDETRAAQESAAPAVGEAVPSGEALVPDNAEQPVQPVQSDPPAVA